MQQDQENHFDESIRRKLQDEEYSPPAFSLSMQETAGPGYKWLRGFLFGDLLLLIAVLVLAVNGREVATAASQTNHEVNKEHKEYTKVNAEENSTVNVSTSENHELSLDQAKANNKEKDNVNANYGNVVPASETKRSNSSKTENAIVHKSEKKAISASDNNKKHVKKNGAVAALKTNQSGEGNMDPTLLADGNSVRSVHSVNAFRTDMREQEMQSELDMMKPIDFTPDASEGSTIKTREFSHSPMKYRKPFSLEPLVLAEFTTAYNKQYPELGELNLDLTPQNNAYGAGLLFNYRLLKRMGIKTGIETVIRRYNLNYSLTQTVKVLQPDSVTYIEKKQVLHNSRKVAEAEVRIPLMFTYQFTPGKWLFEPEAGITIKFKTLEVTSSGSDEIPASVLSTIDVSNKHLVTAGFMFGFQAAYGLSENTMLFLTPYFQTESFGNSSRQYYTGRAVSGSGVKGGLRIFFNQ